MDITFENKQVKFSIKNFSGSITELLQVIQILKEESVEVVEPAVEVEPVVEELKEEPVEPVVEDELIEISLPSTPELDITEELLPDINCYEVYENIEDEKKEVEEEPKNIIFSYQNRQEFADILSDIGIGEKSHKNYLKFWDSLIFKELLLNQDIEKFFKELKNIPLTTDSDFTNAYLLFIVIYKILKKYKRLLSNDDLAQLNRFYEPIQEKKSVIRKKTNTEKKKI